MTGADYFDTIGSVENGGAERPGPRPARTSGGQRLSPTRAALLETLQKQPEPTGVPALVAATGLHANTVREPLEGLRRSGLVRRSPAPAAGRGRPAWRYQATERSHEDPQPEYAGLAAALAAVVLRTSPQPTTDARIAGVEWGRRIAGTVPAADTPESARHTVAEIFEDMGFAPDADADAREMRLTRCPLLEAAHQHPDIVCSVHLGIAEGVLETHGAPTERLELFPFIEPGACLLRLDGPR